MRSPGRRLPASPIPVVNALRALEWGHSFCELARRRPRSTPSSRAALTLHSFHSSCCLGLPPWVHRAEICPLRPFWSPMPCGHYVLTASLHSLIASCAHSSLVPLVIRNTCYLKPSGLVLGLRPSCPMPCRHVLGPRPPVGLQTPGGSTLAPFPGAPVDISTVQSQCVPEPLQAPGGL